MKGKAIGVDIGGTSVKGVVCNTSGEVLMTTRVPTDASLGKDAILRAVSQVILELKTQHPDVGAIGIGTAGQVNVQTGQVVYATDNLPGWHGFMLADWVEEQFCLPVAVDNDANVALVGEAWTGAARGLTDVGMLTLGTGVGGAHIIEGNVHRGATWRGGEWGHVTLIPGGRPCNCGRKGCMEQYLSGSALVRDASEAEGKTYDHGEEVLRAAADGALGASSVLQQFQQHLVIAVMNMAWIINPQAIVIGGGVVDAKSYWWDDFLMKLKEEGLEIDVRWATLGNYAGSIGAAKLGLEKLGLMKETHL
ncbi:ROK family protein [Paenibacillus roseipurpureus]|uniref:ROK family protein n=1 Tax=Paenibacillus roseopurpureus TaxID=2918901 RepID=A0AA96RP03_9BACL|nr:ROK family protein [Paenibacillus sp. MBLB1832]WNR46132.1 ROK family protein [Paenibacillus sp. MBLB1832]